MNTDSLALRPLVGFLNNPEVTGAVVPPEAEREIAEVFDRRGATVMSSDPALGLISSPSKAETEKQTSLVTDSAALHSIDNHSYTQPVTSVSLSRKIFFTGRLAVGKDFCASSIRAKIFGFADPMYFLANYLFDTKVSATEGKQLPGMRDFLQRIGQWGRNEVNEQYPYTPERAMFCLMVRSLANQNVFKSHGVEWGMFGLTQDLWVDGLLKRAKGEGEARVAVTNCRFANEYKRLVNDGWTHWHVVCSPQTWIHRLQTKGLKPDSPEVRDMSESLASNLDRDLTKKLSMQRSGEKLHVIWNDKNVPPPSPRLFTLEQFKSLL